MVTEMQRRAREDGVELSREDAAKWYGGLRDAGILQFVGWDAEGEPQFSLTLTGKQIFCPECGAPAASVSEFLADEWVLECSECEAAWPADADVVRAFEAFAEASHRLL
jgi:hypothetical protein